MTTSYRPTDDLSNELEMLYSQVPATCCASSGECCALTEGEFENHYATMFPLYRAEYHNIVQFVEASFSDERRWELLDFTEERPRRCPFLGTDNRCTIYPVRPLICRTYAVMNTESIALAVERHKGQLPADWIRRFVLRESGMFCPRVRVMELEKLDRHAKNLIESAYERELTRLSEEVELAGDERRAIFAAATGRRSWPLRWSWGGFNSVRFAPLEWLQEKFKGYWKKADLVDAG